MVEMLLETVNASFSYGTVTIFKNISFQLDEGEIFCLLGSNGCGKTTLLDCIIGHLKLNSGKVLIKGSRIDTLRPGDIAKLISYVPQSHEKKFPYKVLDIVLMGRAAYTSMFSSPSGEDVLAAEDALKTVGMYDYRDRPYTQLSGGEGQLVMIARALAQKAPIMILDEPTTHLDFKHELKILETIMHLVRETGLSIIVATHFPNQAFFLESAGIRTRVAIMSNGDFAAVGMPMNVICEDNFRTIFNINARVLSHKFDKDEILKYIIPVATISE